MYTSNGAPAAPRLSLSVVSHGQAALVFHLLADLARLRHHDFEVILTINVHEDISALAQEHPYPVRVIRNPSPKGFGANHNAAFQQCKGEFFAIVNPDIRLESLDLDAFLSPFARQDIAAVAPVVRSANGRIEDSVRRFPTMSRLLRRTLARRREPDYDWKLEPLEVDWAAGMFVVFRPKAFRQIGGFDDRRFFMYFEDVDICARLWRHGWRVMLQPRVAVIHDARRASHKNLKHLRWHLTSAVRYLAGF